MDDKSNMSNEPYRRSDADTAFLLQWAEALGATPDEARAKLAEMDKGATATRGQERPATYHRPASTLSDLEIATEDAWLEAEWQSLHASLDESGGMSGSPGEWIIERTDELATELKRRRAA